MTATVHIDVGASVGQEPYPLGVWDASYWNDDLAVWSGSIPVWAEISCRVTEVDCYRGRSGALDIVQPGTATVTVVNEDGWASWRPDSVSRLAPGSWLRIRALTEDGDEHVLWTGLVRRVVENYPASGALTADIVAVDVLSRLGTVDLPARPPTGAGHTAAQRIGFCLDEVFWPKDLRSLDAGGPTLDAVTFADKMIDHAQRAAVTVGGTLFGSRDGVVCFRDSDWLRTAPRSTEPVAIVANDGRTGAICPVEMSPSGPDLDRIINVATAAGLKVTEESDPVQVIEVDRASTQRYGASSWLVDQLPTTNVDTLTVLCRRTLGMRAQPVPRLESLTLTAIDSASAEYIVTADLGDLIETHYVHPRQGWSWAMPVHVHAVRHTIRPMGRDNLAEQWDCSLTLDDATYWSQAEVWDDGLWDSAHWAGPQLFREIY